MNRRTAAVWMDQWNSSRQSFTKYFVFFISLIGKLNKAQSDCKKQKLNNRQLLYLLCIVSPRIYRSPEVQQEQYLHGWWQLSQTTGCYLRIIRYKRCRYNNMASDWLVKTENSKHKQHSRKQTTTPDDRWDGHTNLYGNFWPFFALCVMTRTMHPGTWYYTYEYYTLQYSSTSCVSKLLVVYGNTKQ